MRKLCKFILAVIIIILPNHAFAKSFQEEIKTKCEEINSELGEYMYSEYFESTDGKYLVFRLLNVIPREDQKELQENAGCARPPKVGIATLYVTIHKSSPSISIKELCLYGKDMDDLLQRTEFDNNDMEWVDLEQSPELLNLPYLCMVIIRNTIKDYGK